MIQARDTFTKPALSPFHENIQDIEELTNKRGLDLPWCMANIKRATAEQATQLLGYTAKSGGLWIEGYGGQGQFKPDEPWEIADGKKPKYLSPKGGYDAIYPVPPKDNNETYWTDLEALRQLAICIDGIFYLILTEGAFKAIAACSVGIPTIGLLGVEMGLTSKNSDPEGKGSRSLLPSLNRFIEAGFGFIIAFDADCITNKNVLFAQKKLTEALKLQSVPVRIATGLWNAAEGKGMDDFIKDYRAEEFKRRLAYANTPEAWEKQFTPQDNSPQAKKKSVRVAQDLADKQREHWTYQNEQKTWRVFNGKVWAKVDDAVFRQIVYKTLVTSDVEFDRPQFVGDVIACLRDELLVEQWVSYDKKLYIAFNNGVLDIFSGELLKYTPGMRLLSHLPYDYQDLKLGDDYLESLQQHCPNIYRFFKNAMRNDTLKIELLLAIVNAVIKFRFYDLQQFVHLLGKPGCGKGTFTRLLQKIVGKGNYHGSKLKALSEGTELATIVDKQLVVFPDERKQTDCSDILSLTGGDDIRYREIYKGAASCPFYGGIVIVSNNPVFVGDTAGLDRRQCLVYFDNPIPKAARDTRVEDCYDIEIGKLIAVALSMPDGKVKELIKGEKEALVPEFRYQIWELKTLTNSIAAWMDVKLVHTPGEYFEQRIGSGEIDSDHDRKKHLSTLFGNYKEFIKNSGLQLISLNNFSKTLLEICNDFWGWNIEKKHIRCGNIITGSIRLRDELDSEILPFSEQLRGEVKVPSRSSHPLQGSTSKPSQENLSGCHKIPKALHATPVINLEEDVPVSNQSFTKDNHASVDGLSKQPCEGSVTAQSSLNERSGEDVESLQNKGCEDREGKSQTYNISYDAASSVDDLFNPPLLPVGTKCYYVGSNQGYYHQYNKLELTVAAHKNGMLSCLMPNGEYTVWFYNQDLMTKNDLNDCLNE